MSLSSLYNMVRNACCNETSCFDCVVLLVALLCKASLVSIVDQHCCQQCRQQIEYTPSYLCLQVWHYQRLLITRWLLKIIIMSNRGFNWCQCKQVGMLCRWTAISAVCTLGYLLSLESAATGPPLLSLRSQPIPRDFRLGPRQSEQTIQYQDAILRTAWDRCIGLWPS